MSDGIKKILNKQTIIPTVSSEAIVKDPARVEEVYRLPAKMHMAIGDTVSYQEKIIKCLITNQSAFNGGVVGEYGDGKTSLLVYLWKVCQDNNIIATPPYQWSKFDEHINVVYHWIKYKIRDYSESVKNTADSIYRKYLTPSIEDEAKRWVTEHNVDYDTALKIIKDHHEKGSISLGFKPERLLDFCSEITEFLIRETRYKGLLIITDELQQTITELNHNEVYDFLFTVTNSLVGANGNYGFLWGFPERTHADLSRVRSDILDRMNSNNAFIRLGNMYDQKFPSHLWNSFCSSFGLEDYKHLVVDPETLVAIGQVCDTSRRDIGNGPRSVISAFKAMASHFDSTQKTYSVFDFVHDCLDEKIILGENSSYKKTINEILLTANIDDEDRESIVLLSGFPEGIPNSVLEKYGKADTLDKLVKVTGGLGRVVVKDINSYRIKALRKIDAQDTDDTVIEEEIRRYFSGFSVDKNSQKTALSVFNSIIPTHLFPVKQNDYVNSWKLTSEKTDHNYKNNYFYLKGSFDKRFPHRTIRVITRLSNVGIQSIPSLEKGKTHLGLNFVFHSEGLNKNMALVERKGDENNFIINLDFNTNNEELNNQRLKDIVPVDKHSPLFFLGLIAHLNDADIPNNEKPEYENLLEVLIENIIYNLFSDDILGEIEGTEIELNNQGTVFLEDLFTQVCFNTYPEYVTLVRNRTWEKKITAYINVLKTQENSIGLMEKRGKAPVYFDEDKSKNKQRIASLFNIGVAAFDSTMDDLSDFVDYSFTQNENRFKFKVHPLETLILEAIRTSDKSENIDDYDCKSLPLDDRFFETLFNKGYLREEIDKIIEISQLRKLFFKNDNSSSLYIKPENKNELKDNALKKFDAFFENYSILLRNYTPGPFDISYLEELKTEIGEIETEEQFGHIVRELSNLESQANVFSESKIVSLRTSKNDLLADISKNASSLNSEVEKLDLNPPGSSPWRNELINIAINLTGESKGLLSNLNESKKKIENLLPGELTNKSKATEVLVKFKIDYEHAKLTLSDKYIPQCKVLTDKIKSINKWMMILKLHDQLNTKILPYEKILSQFMFREQINEFDSKVKEELTINQASALENSEIFKQTLIDIKSNLDSRIENLRNDWVELSRQFSEDLKGVIGSEPSWPLRWGEHPRIAYNDLYEAVSSEISRFIDTTKKRFNKLIDDISYTSQVLNHERAVSNKQLDQRTLECIASLEKIESQNLMDSVQNTDLYSELLPTLKNLNTAYKEINTEHLQIIKPVRVENGPEKSFLEMLDSNTNKDLKSLIIEYQKNVDSSINLTESRDKVLDILKDLFIKKQITIQVKRGKV